LNKIINIEEATAMVPDGATIALGGLSMNSTPMAMVRELVRQGKKDLTVVAIVNGMAVDWLIAGGCVRRVISGLISFEGMGLAPNFRHAVETGACELEEYSEYLLIARLRAAASHLPFMPTKAGLGTDVIKLHPETTRLEHDPVTGEPYIACTPLPVDVALVHAHEADSLANVRVNPKLLWMDNEIVNAAGTTIVSVERIIPHDDFLAAPHRTTYPRFTIDAVVEVPWGAYPSSCFPEYVHDREFYAAYSGAAAKPELFREFWTQRVQNPESHADFIHAQGGTATLLRIRRTSV
jgi:glutaconate CoA-transferase subunit A